MKRRLKIPWNILLPIVVTVIFFVSTLLIFKKYFYFTRENTGLDDCSCIRGEEEYTISPTINTCDCVLLIISGKKEYYSVKYICNDVTLKSFIEDCVNDYFSKDECQTLPKAYYDKYLKCIKKCCS